MWIYLIALAWMYVVLMMALAEAMSAQGTVLGALITFTFYGVLPLALVLYILGTPLRKRRRRAAEMLAERAQAEEAAATATGVPPSDAPDGGSHAPGDAVAPVRKEP